MSVLDLEPRYVSHVAAGPTHFHSKRSSSRRSQSDSDSAIPAMETGDDLRVLIVGANSKDFECMVRHIGQWTRNLQVACDGLAALRIAASQHPQVVIVQLELPWMSGCELARHLRTDFPKSDALIVGLVKAEDSKLRQFSILSGVDILLVESDYLASLETLLVLECIHQNCSQARGARNQGDIKRS